MYLRLVVRDKKINLINVNLAGKKIVEIISIPMWYVPNHGRTKTAVVVLVYPFQNQQNRINPLLTALIRLNGQLFPYICIVIRFRTVINPF